MSLKTLSIKYTVVLLGLCVFYFIYMTNVSSVDDVGQWSSALSEEDVQRLTCKCHERQVPDITADDLVEQSTCDLSATLRGSHQHVLSFSVANRNAEKDLRNIEITAISVANWLPDWVIRVYHNVDVRDEKASQLICSIWCKYPRLDFCQVSNLPPPLMDQSNISSSIWKFLVFGDPLVDRFLISDAGSTMSETEADAVTQWTASGSAWTFMRFHPIYHSLPKLLGVLGGVNDNLSMTIDWRRRLMEGETLTLNKKTS